MKVIRIIKIIICNKIWLAQGTHWIALHVNGNHVTYFDNFGVEYIQKEINEIHRQQKYHNE